MTFFMMFFFSSMCMRLYLRKFWGLSAETFFFKPQNFWDTLERQKRLSHDKVKLISQRWAYIGVTPLAYEEVQIPAMTYSNRTISKLTSNRVRSALNKRFIIYDSVAAQIKQNQQDCNIFVAKQICVRSQTVF